MTEYAPQPFRPISSESNAAWVALDAVFRPTASSYQVFSHPEDRTAASQQGSVVWRIRPYTGEELRMIEGADKYPADLREQVKAFLEG
jgi:hypothetical protein